MLTKKIRLKAAEERLKTTLEKHEKNGSAHRKNEKTGNAQKGGRIGRPQTADKPPNQPATAFLYRPEKGCILWPWLQANR